MFSDFTREFNSLLPESDSTVKKEDPAPESVHSISESLSMQEKCYKELARFVDKLRLELVQFRVRPGVRRSARLHDESQVLADEIHRIKAKLEKCDEMLEEDSDLKKDLDARITSLLQDQSELHNVIVMIQEVVTIQEGSKEIEVPYFHTISAEELQTTKARPFMDELVIKTQCFTSQERMETFDKYMDLRNWEKQFFHFETDFKKELKKSVKDRVNPMGSIWRLEQYRRQKDTKLRLNLFREERQLFNL